MHRWIAALAVVIGVAVGSSQVHAGDRETCIKTDSESAIGACTRLIASGRFKGPTLATIYLLRGKTWLGQKETDRAIADFGLALDADAKSSQAYFYRANAKCIKNDLDGALIDYNLSIAINPKEAAAFHNRGNTFFDKGEIDRAIADYSEAIRLDPGHTAAYTHRGMAYEKKSDRVRARADYEAALAVPQRHSNGKWAQDAARERLAAVTKSPFPAFPSFSSPPNVAPPQAFAPPLAVSPPASSTTAAPPPATAALAPPSLAAAAPSSALPGRRAALVIGNSAYATFPKIPNPRNDAEDLGKALTGLGFEVLLGTDLTRAEMEERLIRFSRQARSADTALVFYAGHGIQHQGINYLAPVDAKLEDESDLRRLINLQDVIADLQGASRVRILMVDACRDNEAVQQLASNLPKTRAAAFSRGLAKVDADGTLIAFATQANRIAADGDGRNSPFTAALLKHLPAPGIELRTLMTRVRADVVQTTEGKQRPEVWDSMVGEFSFNTRP